MQLQKSTASTAERYGKQPPPPPRIQTPIASAVDSHVHAPEIGRAELVPLVKVRNPRADDVRGTGHDRIVLAVAGNLLLEAAVQEPVLDVKILHLEALSDLITLRAAGRDEGEKERGRVSIATRSHGATKGATRGNTEQCVASGLGTTTLLAGSGARCSEQAGVGAGHAPLRKNWRCPRRNMTAPRRAASDVSFPGTARSGHPPCPW